VHKARLTKEGLILYEPKTATTYRLDRKETEEVFGAKINFSRLEYMCEVAHLEICARCQLDCEYCYFRKLHKSSGELSTAQWKAVIDDFAAYGAFQLTFGGGEPTLREDLHELAEHVREVGMNLTMTTNGLELPALPEGALQSFGQINVSYHRQLGMEPFKRALNRLAELDLPRGINYLCLESPPLELLRIARELRAQLLLIAPKDAPGLSPKDVYSLAVELYKDGLNTAIDGLTGALCGYGCMQKKRFCTVDPLGNVLPCSFVRQPYGNLLQNKFQHIWVRRGALEPCKFLSGKEI